MTAHALMVLVTGLTFLASAGVLAAVFRFLGPTFHTRVNAHWGWRTLAFVAMAVMMWRGVTILFPGQLVQVARMSPVATAEALVVLAGTLAILDWVMKDRAPPPWTVTLTRLTAVLGWDAMLSLGMKTPIASVGDPPPLDDPPGRLFRMGVVVCGLLIIVAVTGVIATVQPT